MRGAKQDAEPGIRAIACFLEALDIEPASGPASHGVRAETLAELGETHQAAGDWQSARKAWEQAVEMYESLHHPAAGQMRDRLDQRPGSPGPPAV